jgi:hypothetical protein
MIGCVVVRKERGWAGHFICANRCRFRRNTLLEYNGMKIVVSTVGLMEDHFNKNEFIQIGAGRYYETMAFRAKKRDRYKDADVSKEVAISGKWYVDNCDEYSDVEANDMHEGIVEEVMNKLKSVEKYE